MARTIASNISLAPLDLHFSQPLTSKMYDSATATMSTAVPTAVTLPRHSPVAGPVSTSTSSTNAHLTIRYVRDPTQETGWQFDSKQTSIPVRDVARLCEAWSTALNDSKYAPSFSTKTPVCFSLDLGALRIPDNTARNAHGGAPPQMLSLAAWEAFTQKMAGWGYPLGSD